MLTIRADSWHLRLWRWAHESKTATPKNLCRYFWFLFLVITLPTIAAIALLIGAALLLWVIFHHWETSALVFAAMAGLVLLGVATYYLQKWAERNRKAKRRRLEAEGQWPPPPKEPNIIVSWLKAKKQKVCPLIAVKEADD